MTLEVSAYGFAKAYCQTRAITEIEGFRKVHTEIREKFNKYALSPSVIKRRRLVFFPRPNEIRYSNGEFTVIEPEQEHLQLFDNYDSLKAKDIKVRHGSYARVADDCLTEMYGNAIEAPDDIIHVTCSGYLAPSPVERMVASKEWFNTTVTHSYHMGCYGAFPAIRMAHGFLFSSQSGATPPKERIDIVHTEVLSVHSDVEELRAENIITMTLFSDGFIKYSAVSEDYLRQHGLQGLKILAFNEHLLPNSADDMTWVPGSTRFHIITLTVMVPVVIKQSVRSFVEGLLRRAGIDFERERSRLHFAIHPGGPKIVEHIQENSWSRRRSGGSQQNGVCRERQYVLGDGPAYFEGDIGRGRDTGRQPHRLARFRAWIHDYRAGVGENMTQQREHSAGMAIPFRPANGAVEAPLVGRVFEVRAAEELTMALEMWEESKQAEPLGVEAPTAFAEYGQPDASNEPVLPFVGVVLDHAPGMTITVERRLDLQEDLYLADHAFVYAPNIKPARACLPVLPMTMSLEAMAEVAACLVPGCGLLGFEEVTATRWIELTDTDALTLRITARLEHYDAERGAYFIGVAINIEGQATPTISATALFGESYLASCRPPSTS